MFEEVIKASLNILEVVLIIKRWGFSSSTYIYNMVKMEHGNDRSVDVVK